MSTPNRKQDIGNSINDSCCKTPIISARVFRGRLPLGDLRNSESGAVCLNYLRSNSRSKLWQRFTICLKSRHLDPLHASEHVFQLRVTEHTAIPTPLQSAAQKQIANSL